MQVLCILLSVFALQASGITIPTSTRSDAGSESTGLPSAMTDSSIDPNVTALANLWGWNGCSDSDKEAVLGGLGEAHSVLQSDGCFSIKAHWNDYALVEYLGSPRYNRDHQEEISENFYNAFLFVHHPWIHRKDTHVYCHDNSLYEGDCASAANSIVVQNDYNGRGLSIILCNHWFSLGKLKAAYNSARGGNKKFDLRQYDNRAVPWLSALFQVDTVSTFPRVDDKLVMRNRKIKFPNSPFQQWVSDPAQVKYLSKYHRAPVQQLLTWSNPNNWAWYALATYVQQKLGEYPHRPLSPKELPPPPLSILGLTKPGNESLAEMSDEEEAEIEALAAAYGIDLGHHTR